MLSNEDPVVRSSPVLSTNQYSARLPRLANQNPANASNSAEMSLYANKTNSGGGKDPLAKMCQIIEHSVRHPR